MSGAYQAEVLEVLAGQRYAASRRSLDQIKAMARGHRTALAPLVDRRHRDADLNGKLLNEGLHGRIIDTVSSDCQALSVDIGSIAEPPAGQHVFDMPAREPSIMLEGYAERVYRARVAAGYKTQRELATALGVSHHAVSVWEKGRNFAHAPDLAALARVLDVTIDWLVTGDTRGLPVSTLKRLNNA